MKLNLSVGDIFRFGDPENGWGYGQILRTEIIQYIVVFEPIFGAEAELEEISASPLLLSGWTSDARFFSGDWQIVGNRAPRHVIFPEYKVAASGDTWVTDVNGNFLRLARPEEAERLSLRTSHAPITFEDAYWAHHGKLPWDPWFDRLAIKA